MSTIEAPTFDDPGRVISVDDVSPELDPATFDLNAWIGGVKGSVRSVRIYQRADLMAEVDELKRQLRVAESIPDEDRGMNDATPDGIRRRMEEVAREFEASGVTVKIEGRSDEARDRIKKRLKKQGVTDEETVALHQLADAIVEPKGFTADVLRKLQVAAEPQVKLMLVAQAYANGEPPKVDVPFSSVSSQGRRRERSS